MGSNSYRGEISQIADDIFINYALGLPLDQNPASTSGYFWKEPPGSYSYFIVQAVDPNSPRQTTQVQKPGTTEVLAAIEWTNLGSERAHLGLITGYNPPSDPPAGWEQLALPYYPCYISMASQSKPGMGKDSMTGKMQPHINRITTLNSAILTIVLPQGVSTDGLKVFLYRHKHMSGGTTSEIPQPEDIKDDLKLSVTPGPGNNTLVIGSARESLPMGLYVVAMPVTAAASSSGSTQTPYAGKQTATTPATAA